MECKICGKEIDETNIARREDGEVRTDAFGYYWCQKCVDRYDNIEHGAEKE